MKLFNKKTPKVYNNCTFNDNRVIEDIPQIGTQKVDVGLLLKNIASETGINVELIDRVLNEYSNQIIKMVGGNV